MDLPCETEDHASLWDQRYPAKLLYSHICFEWINACRSVQNAYMLLFRHFIKTFCPGSWAVYMQNERVEQYACKMKIFAALSRKSVQNTSAWWGLGIYISVKGRTLQIINHNNHAFKRGSSALLHSSTLGRGGEFKSSYGKPIRSEITDYAGTIIRKKKRLSNEECFEHQPKLSKLNCKLQEVRKICGCDSYTEPTLKELPLLLMIYLQHMWPKESPWKERIHRASIFLVWKMSRRSGAKWMFKGSALHHWSLGGIAKIWGRTKLLSSPSEVAHPCARWKEQLLFHK